MNFTVHTIHRKELILDPSDIHCKQSVSHPVRGWHISARTGGTFGRNTQDEAYGVDKRGDEIPEELRRRETRIAKMRQAKAAIEAEATERAKASERTKAKATTSTDAETEATVVDDDPKDVTSTDADTTQI
ncbi:MULTISPECIES: hypothetical protein [Ferrimicrobium]|uniref:Uncharacterized protein n=1 Tax=Ferrimicrobium acidiphilum TaxID=121039 RepID=A0ABV3Y4F0_9ACTN|nr:hypothetical protein [Ferrimicrobium sp.]